MPLHGMNFWKSSGNKLKVKNEGWEIYIYMILLVCFSCNSMAYKKNSLSIATILKNPADFINRTVELVVQVGGNCWWIKRQGNICITDGTKSICALGNLPKEIATRPWQKPGKGFLSWKELKTKKMWIKGIIKTAFTKQLAGKADNLINHHIIYIKVIESRWL